MPVVLSLCLLHTRNDSLLAGGEAKTRCCCCCWSIPRHSSSPSASLSHATCTIRIESVAIKPASRTVRQEDTLNYTLILYPLTLSATHSYIHTLAAASCVHARARCDGGRASVLLSLAATRRRIPTTNSTAGRAPTLPPPPPQPARAVSAPARELVYIAIPM